MFFFFPEQLSNATSTILALLTVTNILTIVSLGMLTNWLKIGFWIFLGIQIANVPLCLSAGLGIIQSLLGVFSAGLLWLFMQIPKDSYSGWDYLSGNYVSIRDTEITVNGKKCRMCGTFYTGAIIGCPHCGSFLYEEIAKNKKCRMCNTVYAYSLSGCPHCDSSFYEETTEEILAAEKKEAPVIEEKSNINSKNNNAEIERLEKLFESTSDEKEKSLIAKQLYEMGVMYYWRFMPKDK